MLTRFSRCVRGEWRGFCACVDDVFDVGVMQVVETEARRERGDWT